MSATLVIQNAPSKDSDQRARMRRLIRIFFWCMAEGTFSHVEAQFCNMKCYIGVPTSRDGLQIKGKMLDKLIRNYLSLVDIFMIIQLSMFRQ